MSETAERYHKRLYQRAERAIRALYADRGVSADRTRDSLVELIEQMEVMLDGLEKDMEYGDV